MSFAEKPRIVVTTDLGVASDDQQLLLCLTVCSIEFDIEGLIVSTGCWKKKKIESVLLDQILNARRWK